MINQDDIALGIVHNYIISHKDEKTRALYSDFIAWKCKILQNWKYLIGTDMNDGKYYEVTCNGDKEEWYLDVYQKVENVVIKEKDIL